MRLRQTEVQTTGAAAYSAPVQTNASEEYEQAEQESMTNQVGLTATKADEGSHFNTGEALRVTLCMMGLAVLAHTVTNYLTSATASMLFPFPVAPGIIPRIISGAVLALNVAAVGIGVGMLANRRTMTASIVAANVAGILVTALVLAYFYATIPPGSWAAPTLGMLFQAVTVTFTEVAVALYVARKFRKKP